ILDVMNAAIPQARSEVRETAPKIVSFEIPIDKIGEVIGPKGKVINTIQQETGADISVGDDGMVGTVSIGSKDGEKVEEAKRRIMLILDPPTAELGAVYKGRVVNITKFGAFINILPGRDGLVHISKLGGGKRIDRVEDVLSLGMELEVKVDDIDQSGKLSLSLVGDDNGSGGSGGSGGGSGGGGSRGSSDRGSERGSDRGERTERPEPARRESSAEAGDTGGAAPASSFEDFWEDQAKAEFGDLGPAPDTAGAGRGSSSGSAGSGPGGGARRRRPPRRR
ncbi:MAG: polyribonucleotide nucleotidyltransferase, partial [Actinomycetota bacterium]|nr:polyribonucleotide nucleotidyltransferase [Actinomycetota bacterium]